MPCEHFEDALIEAAVSGAELQGELRVHVKNCTACRAAFEQEKALFEAMDSGMHVVANAEVPTSLVPRVRGALDEMAVPSPAWSPKWFVLAGAGAMLAFFFVTQNLWRARFEPKLTESATSATQSPPLAQHPPKEIPGAIGAQDPGSSMHRAYGDTEKIPLQHAFSNREGQLEILVPQDQEALLAHYAQEWRNRKPLPMAIAASNESTLTPLEVTPIQIAELDVKPLAETQSQ